MKKYVKDALIFQRINYIILAHFFVNCLLIYINGFLTQLTLWIGSMKNISFQEAVTLTSYDITMIAWTK